MVITMRNFYIFNIDSSIAKLYKENEFVLYDILYEIYKLDKDEILLGFKFFKQFVSRINKGDINVFIYNNLKNNMTYMKTMDKHVIYDKFGNENSEIKIHNSHILLKTNKEISKFIFLLSKYKNNFFVCDFDSKDYFWINNLIKTVQ